MRLNKHLLKYILLALILLPLYGCPYDSDVPLTRSEDASIDTELIGKWKFMSTTPRDAGMITISPFNEHEFLIVLKEEGKNSRDYYRAFVSIIDGAKFLNLQTIRPTAEKKSWMLVNYSISGGELTILVVGDKLIKEKFHSSPPLRELIKVNLKNRDLYGEDESKPMKFVREPMLNAWDE